MKGKKIDLDFVSEFINRSIANNCKSPKEIINEAQNQIQEIDNKIIEVERLKILRSKLIDVVSSLSSIEKKVI